jgi:hypothetical protein
MGLLIGPTPWWQQNVIAVSPVGTTLPDGSKVICRAGGTAWIVAPSCTQVSQTYNNLGSGNKPCVCDWPTLNTCLITRGFNPADWFVPSCGQLQNPGYVCRTNWDTFSVTQYWSSDEFADATPCAFYISFDSGGSSRFVKTLTHCVRAFRCVTY